MAAYRRLLSVEQRHVDSLYGMVRELHVTGRLNEAMACFDRAIAIEPTSAITHFNRGMLRMLLGDLAGGFAEYEWRQRVDAIPQPAYVPPRRWDGSSPAGKSILLHIEQGFGDVIQMVRYAELIKNAGGSTLISGYRELGGLLATCPWIDHVVPYTTPLPDFDAYIPIMSLPHVCGTTPSSIPANVPYFFPDAARVEAWASELGSGREAKIGIAWQGSRMHRAIKAAVDPASRSSCCSPPCRASGSTVCRRIPAIRRRSR